MEGIDLIIVGGGIHGMMLAMQATTYHLKPLLLEKYHFGHTTSRNSFQIIHGGLRYLQTLDFKRYHESHNERSWFLSTFPDLIEPLPVLFPLYDRGTHRKSLFRIAFFLDTLLSKRYLPAGRILSKQETISIFPDVDQRGLKGAAQWYDATIVDQDQLMTNILKLGGTAIHSMNVQRLLLYQGKVQGVVAIDTSTKNEITFKSNVVVNATGPWCRAFARQVDRDIPRLFYPSLAFNILFDRKPLSTHALAVRSNDHTYFLRPLNHQLFAGTYHLPWAGSIDKPNPPEEHIDRFLSDLNHAIPKLHLKKQEIKSIRAGFLPAKQEGTDKLASRDVIIDHGKIKGPIGLYSVSGIKWTTSRKVAEKTLQIVRRNHPKNRV